MATSNTTTLTSSHFLAGEDPETVEANRKYQEALSKLTDSLDSRKNRLFDPIMLAMAQGFATPGQTGSFGESLGNVAKNVGAAQEQETKNDQEIARQQFAIAGQGVELQRSKSRDADISRYLAGEPPPTRPTGPLTPPTPVSSNAPEPGPLAAPRPVPSAAPIPGPLSAAPSPEGPPVAPPVAPVGGLTQAAAPAIAAPAQAAPEAPAQVPREVPRPALAPTAAAPVGGLTAAQAPQGVQVMPANPSFMSQKDYVRLNRGDKSQTIGQLLAKGAELEQKRYAKTEAGTTDYRTGLFYPSPSSKFLDMPILGEGYNGGTYKVPESVALQLTQFANENNWAGYKALADKFTGKKAGPAGAPEGIGSIEDQAVELERRKALSKARTDQEIEDRKNFAQRAREADDTITLAGQFRRFAADPASEKMTGILNNDKISSAIAKAVESGIGNRSFHVGVPEIEDIMRNAGLNKEEQAKYRTFLMLTVESQLLKTKYMKGSISNYEDRLLGNAGINAQDTRETIRMKADLFTRRAQFDRRAAKDFKSSKMTAEDYLDSPRYAEMRDKYNEDLAELSFGNQVLVPSVSPSTNPSVKPSAGFILDNGTIRRKKPGE
jgi:hypothetical protein